MNTVSFELKARFSYSGKDRGYVIVVLTNHRLHVVLYICFEN